MSNTVTFASSLTLWVAIIVYSLATFRAFRGLRVGQVAKQDSNAAAHSTATWVIPMGLVAWLAHTAYAVGLALSIDQAGVSLSLSVASMSAVVSAILSGTFFVLCRFMTLSRLAVVVFPLCVIALLFSHFWNIDNGETLLIATSTNLSLKLHVLVSILAYTFISISAIQALVYRYQESQFKNRSGTHILAALPPLETMNSLVFRLLLIGFVLLSLTLLSGSVFSQAVLGVPFEISHHTVFAVFAWALSAYVLIKRNASGMGGRQATPWIIAIFICLQLGYFGSKIIFEILN